MYCKNCGKQSTSEICDECVAKLARENAAKTKSTENAENTAEATVAPGGEPAANPNTANPTNAAPAKPASAYRSGGSEDWHYGSKFAKTYNGVGYGGYTRTSGLVLGILSTVFPWAGLFASIISLLIFGAIFKSAGIVGVIIILTFSAGLILSLVFGIKAIVEFKRAKRSGVTPVATLILGIAGFSQIVAVLTIVMQIVSYGMNF